MNDLPQYTIRESARAKHVIIKTSLRDGLVVVVPKDFAQRQVPQILTGKREWIERALARIEQKKAVLAADSDGVLPARINLNAINEEWLIDYEQGVASRVTLTVQGERRLLISGDIGDLSLVRTVLRRFLISKAKVDLIAWLRFLADERGFVVNKVSVRLQKTRWGTCSFHGAISLNAKLLFLPHDLVDYVMIHELCHSVHHNHSASFWRLVEEHMPQAGTMRRRLRDDAWRFIPPWLDGVQL